MAKMHSTNDQTSVFWGGQVFEADERGLFDVPEKALTDLMSHGLVIGERVTTDEPEVVAVPVSNWKNVDLLAKAEELGLELPAAAISSMSFLPSSSSLPSRLLSLLLSIGAAREARLVNLPTRSELILFAKSSKLRSRSSMPAESLPA